MKSNDLTPVQRIFQEAVAHYSATVRWEESYAKGLLDAFIILTGEADLAREQYLEAVDAYQQHQHAEYLKSQGAE